jgi:hypothetical protein
MALRCAALPGALRTAVLRPGFSNLEFGIARPALEQWQLRIAMSSMVFGYSKVGKWVTRAHSLIQRRRSRVVRHRTDRSS